MRKYDMESWKGINYKSYPILFVDDERLALETFNIQFKNEFDIHTANNVKEAISILDRVDIAVVITDQRMPDMGGIELLKMIKIKSPEVVRMLITAYTDMDVVIDAINKGNVYRYITKPYNEDEVRISITQGIERYFLTRERDRLYAEKIETLKKISRANRLTSVGTLAAGMAHEINNPLAAISTFLQLVPQKYEEEKRDDGFWDNYYHVVLEELERIRNIIVRLLQYSKFIPKEELELEEKDINTILENMIIFIENEARRREIIIKRDYKKDILKIMVNTESIKQVFLNLLLNAIQAMPNGGEIIARTRNKIGSDNSKLIEVSIIDTGIGISEENLKKLFAPFFTTKNQEGSGLGLIACYQIVDSHRGTIDVQSELGKGASFTVTLPLNPTTHDRRKGERRGE
ncbi:MAG: ATP-binding protein [Nitrospirota bacterium]